MSGSQDLEHFRNEPYTDFSQPVFRRAMETALAKVRSAFGRHYPSIIDGHRLSSPRQILSLNPSHCDQVVGTVPDAGLRQADRALDTAVGRFESWSREPVSRRVGALEKMATLLARQKFEFAAWIIHETGKNWAEADADVAEAIDFLRYYALLARRAEPRLSPVRGERNHLRYLPIGPVAVIPPWNFPLAIMVGMTCAAVAAGNTVVLKPSSFSPVIAACFLALAEEADLPRGVINLISGSGALIGDYLVGDPRTRMIAFTGSKAVGLRINARAAKAAPGQRWIKRVIAEMGGKNAIVVDESADLDAAAQGVIASAFGYQGQKCSACSRAYVHRRVYAEFVDRLREKVSRLSIGPAEDAGHFMGPVISQQAMQRIQGYMDRGRREGRVVCAGHADRTDGYYLPPMVFDRLPAQSRLFQEEIFGPVLALQSVRHFEEGLALANHTDYGLTGAVFSKRRRHFELATQEFACGNLYLNRKCTGALVGGHPFGGFNMSGTDSKAGGPDYLLLFTQAKVITEKL